jgi:hypothetical protein
MSVDKQIEEFIGFIRKVGGSGEGLLKEFYQSKLSWVTQRCRRDHLNPFETFPTPRSPFPDTSDPTMSSV